MDSLLDYARHHAEAHCINGIASTAIPGLAVRRETVPTALQYAISKPLEAIVLQHAKRVTVGNRTFEFGQGSYLLISNAVPTASHITKASIAKPYISLVLDLCSAVISELVNKIVAVPNVSGGPARVDLIEREISDAALRLMRLLHRPTALAVLSDQLFRELHLWLLSERHGSAIGALGITDSHAQRIARAVSLIRTGYGRTMRISVLAKTAVMSLSAFHQHFRSITSLTPLQFQEQLRFIEARRLLMSAAVTWS